MKAQQTMNIAFIALSIIIALGALILFTTRSTKEGMSAEEQSALTIACLKASQKDVTLKDFYWDDEDTKTELGGKLLTLKEICEIVGLKNKEDCKNKCLMTKS